MSERMNSTEDTSSEAMNKRLYDDDDQNETDLEASNIEDDYDKLDFKQSHTPFRNFLG